MPWREMPKRTALQKQAGTGVPAMCLKLFSGHAGGDFGLVKVVKVEALTHKDQLDQIHLVARIKKRLILYRPQEDLVAYLADSG